MRRSAHIGLSVTACLLFVAGLTAEVRAAPKVDLDAAVVTLPIPTTLPEVTIPTTLPEVTIPTTLPEVTTTLPEVTTTLPAISTTVPIVPTTVIGTPPSTGSAGETTTTTDSVVGGTDQGAGPADPTLEPTSEELVFAAENGVILNLAPEGGSEFGGSDGLDPITGFTVGFNALVEAISSEFLKALALGLVIAFLAVQGIRDPKQEIPRS